MPYNEADALRAAMLYADGPACARAHLRVSCIGKADPPVHASTIFAGLLAHLLDSAECLGRLPHVRLHRLGLMNG
jgi:hypothetical protein